MRVNKILIRIGISLLTTFLVACGGHSGADYIGGNAGGDGMGVGQELLLISEPNVAKPYLGEAKHFAVFGGGAGITNQGTQTQIYGDMGTTGASTLVTGFHTKKCDYTETPLNKGKVIGKVYTNVPPALGVECTEGTVLTFEKAKAGAAAALAAYNDMASRPDGFDPGAGQLGGLTLVPGVYKSAAGPFLITGSDLTLDARGKTNAVWIFQMASSLTVGAPAAPRNVILINGAQAKNVYWQVGSAATINGAGGGTMVGTIIASAGITLSTPGNLTATTLNGRAIGLFASVTMVNAVVNSNASRVVAGPAPVVTGTTITGTNAANVVVVNPDGIVNVENNGGLVTATQTGTGTINIINNGGVLTATNTGNGVMTIYSDATGAVTVTNTGNGNTTVTATGAAAVTYTHTGDDDVSYP